EERFGDEVVEGQNQDRGRDHRVGGGGTHALRAAARIVAVVAAHQRDQETEGGGLDQAGDDIVDVQELGGVGEIRRLVEAELVDADEIAAEDADGVGDQHQHGQRDHGGDQPRCDQIL